MKAHHEDVSKKSLHTSYDTLSEREQHVARHVAERKHISKNIYEEAEEQQTFGERIADHVASFGGSWTFLGLFALVLLCWIALNSVILVRYNDAFDPYPYILLNLVLSMIAAVQAPVIMMSQNRHAQKDRANAEHDYEVNLKAELEIMMLHEKLDHLREHQWQELVAMQQEQIRLLTCLLSELQQKST